MDLKKYLRNVISVSGLTFISQALSLLTTPVLSRIFSPEDYGAIAIYTSIVAIMEACASLSYTSGIALDKEMRDAKATTLLCVVITCIVGIIGMAVVGIVNLIVETDQLLKMFIIVLPIMVIFPDIAAAYEGWLKRCKRYNTIGILNVINVAVVFISSLLLGLMGYKASGLLIARCISAIVFAVVVFIVVKKSTDYDKYSVNKDDLIRQAIYHKKFPMFQMPLVIMNSFSGQLPTIIMTANYPANEIGNYSKGYSISSVPSQVIGKSVGTVFYQESALLYDDNELMKLSKYTFRKLLVLSIVMVFGLTTLAPKLFAIVLGEKWYVAGVCSAIMAPMIAGIFITQPLSNLVFVKGKQHMGIPIGIGMIIIRVITLGLAIYFHLSFFNMLAIYSIVSGLMYIVINSYYLSLTGIKKCLSLILPTILIFGVWLIGLFIKGYIL